MAATETASHAADMDAIYRLQRHIYDATRKYYLLGRDHLIGELRAPEGGSILEVGCGTGRNLILAARRYPSANLFGFDISRAMLETAEENIRRAGLSSRIRLAAADAATFDPVAAFGIQNFDRVFLSYTLSMIPPWEEALARAVLATAPGGSVYAVDFGNQDRLPRAFRTALFAWLAHFHVTPRASLERACLAIAAKEGAKLTFMPLYRDYARYARLDRKT